MIMTVVTGDGKLQAAAAGDIRWSEVSKQPAKPGEFVNGIEALPGQTIQIIDVPDKFRGLLTDPTDLMAQLDSLLKTRGLL